VPTKSDRREFPDHIKSKRRVFHFSITSRLLKNAVFLLPARRYRATDIFDGCKPLKMGAIRKPRCQTGRLNAATKSPGAILDNGKGVSPQG
jgi:hypothetical protein